MRWFRVLRAMPSARLVASSTVVLCVLFVISGAEAQDTSSAAQDQPQQPPVLSVTSHEVLLDIVVTDGGHSLTGLKASDFIVTEEGKPQVVASLEEHQPMSAEMNARLVANPPLAPNTFSNYLIFKFSNSL